MYLPKPFHALLLSGALSVAFIACKRDEVTPGYGQANSKEAYPSESRTNEEEANFAAAHIAASENLEIPAAVAVPDNQPSGNSRIATFYAIGVQKYKAREKAGSNPVSYEWAFVAPEATLFDSGNNQVGNHGAGPFWTVSAADSIFAQQFVPARTAPGADAGSVDWLLLMPKAGKTPTGIFADVDYIQRIATKGGKAPLTPPVSSAETVEVKYKAVYRFTAKNP